ncbi:hypothetical protein F5Y07DRAFT_399331 [Xylaria sp. FL0933]|nr:hypothetical protein F5Y07DRAFT_399331 [Xylaria sp. FL0933]
MSSRLQWHSPNVPNRSGRSEYPIVKDKLPVENAKSKMRRFYAFSNEINSSEDLNPAERQHGYTSYLNTPDFRTPPTTHSFIFHSCGRHNLDERDGRRSRTRTPLLSQPSCRKSFSMGHVCNKYGLTEMHPSGGRHISDTVKEMNPRPNHLPLPTVTYGTQSFANPLYPVNPPQISPFLSPVLGGTPKREKWKSARDMFTHQHKDKIDTQRNRSSRYRTDSSWLSRDDEQGVQRTPSRSPTPILRDSSHKREERDGQVQSRRKQLTEQNPFLFRDRKSREQETESDVSSHSANRKECDDPVCRATHAGHHPFRHSVSCPKHQSKQKSPALDGGSAPGGPAPAEPFESPALNTSLPPEQPHNIHRHHSAGFHSSQHIAEHLSSAVGHNAYDLIKERKERKVQPASSSKSSIRPGLYIEPLTKAKSVTGVGSFQWAPDPVGTGHPARSGNGRRSPAPKATTNGPNRSLSSNTSEEITREVRDTMPGEASVHDEPRDVYNDSNVSLRDNEPPKLRLATTERMSTAMATFRASKSMAEEAMRPVAHQALLLKLACEMSQSNDLIVKGTSDTPTNAYDTNRPSRARTSEFPDFGIEAARSETEHKHQRSDTQYSHEEEHATPLSQHASPRQRNTFTSTNQQSEHERLEHREGQSFNEQAFEPEIAKPTPIAPPNHECSWKERYLDLTAEIRQLKAELSTRASLKSSDILGHGYAHREDDLDLLEVTIILHFRDRDDIVINTDVVRDPEPSSS